MDEAPLGTYAGRIALRWVAPPGWDPAPAGFKPDAAWEPNPYWPESPPHWGYWQVEGPPELLTELSWECETPEGPDKTWFSPPGWPEPPPGFTPNDDWAPDPRWPPAPAGWVFWRVTDASWRAYREAQVATRGHRLRELNAAENLVSHHLPAMRRTVRHRATTAPALSRYEQRRRKLLRTYEAPGEAHMRLLEEFARAETAVRDTLLWSLENDASPPESYFEWVAIAHQRGNAVLDEVDPYGVRAAASNHDTAHGLEAPVDDVEWQSAERLAAEAIRSFGFDDASVTPPGADGGVDVRARGLVAQVKYLNRPVGRPVLQQLVGAAAGSRAVCFSRRGYTKEAQEYALQAGIALYVIELPSSVTAVNGPAAHLTRA